MSEDQGDVAETTVPVPLLEDTAAPQETAVCAAANAVMSAVAGLDRGVVAMTADVKRVSTAVEAFETVAAPAQDVVAALEGSWRLIYSSSLVEAERASTSDLLARYATTLVDAPTARSRLAIGQIVQRVSGTSVEEEVALRLRVPWPLPPAPELVLTFSSSLRASGDGASLTSELESIALRLTGTDLVALPPATLPLGGLSAALSNAAEALPAPLASLPLAKEAARIEAGARALSITALGAGVRVSRSSLGELRVFARDVRDGSSVSAMAMDAEGLRQVAMIKEEVDALRRQMGESERSLQESEQRAAAKAAAAAEELAKALEVADAKAAAAQAVAAAEQAETSERLNEESANALREAEARASSELSALQHKLDLAMAKAEEEAADAKAAHLEEKADLTKRLAEAEDRAAKAKAAAIAAISDL